MIIIDSVIVSEEILKEEFVCNLSACKGECCVAGEAGAPITEKEILDIEDNWDSIKDYIPKKGKEIVNNEGYYQKEIVEGTYETPLVNGKECVYTHFDEKGNAQCGIELAKVATKGKFDKPLSCALYPIRVTKLPSFTVLNYHRWEICSDACTLGQELKIPIYKFLKKPLIRTFGEEWYTELVKAIDLEKK